MISLRFKQLEKLLLDNSPVVLTAIGVVGTVTTAVLTHKASKKAADQRLLRALDEHVEEIDDASVNPLATIKDINGLLERLDELETEPIRDRVKLVWQCYIPPVAAGTITIGCIVMANHVGTKRAAALAAAYTISEKAYAEYREKVVEKIGENKERAVRDDIAQDRVRRNPPNEGNVIVLGSGDVRCCELYTGRYFESSVEEIKKAMNDTNYSINTHGYASMSDFYDRIGLPRTAVSDEMGWTSDKLMDIEFSTVLSEDGRPCVAINYAVEPIRGYHRFR